ncbi:MAG: hypothetical protein K2M44_01285 [Clostridia bacterium]|nr:hypothetical protein [Clostridia bacterium]
MTFRSYVETWIEIYKKPNLKPASIANTLSAIKHAINNFGDKPINNISTDSVQILLLSMRAERMRNLCKT